MPLELKNGPEYFDKYIGAHVARFNCGRNAIAAAFLYLKPKKIYIPYYVCSVVRETLEKYALPYELYFLDDQLEPKIGALAEDEWLLYVNYFGTMPDSKIEGIVQRYKRVVLDHTQAFYASPVLDEVCFNVFLPRKFFGLIDGAYLVWGRRQEITFDYPIDVSWDKGAFLFKSAELGTNAAYQDNLGSMECFSDGIRRMSRLTERMLRSIDYETAGAVRQRNYQMLVRELSAVNELPMPMEGYAPYVYPLLIKHDTLRKQIVEQKVYVPQWWKYLLNEVPDDSVEAIFSKWLLPLPVDHRYCEEDMRDISRIIKSHI